MVRLFALAQVNLNSFRVMLKMAVFVMHSFARQIMIAETVFVAVVNVQLPVEIKMIAPTENIAQTIVV